MTRKEHLLIIFAEECNEISQRATKALRFGINEIQEGQSKSNSERIKYELNDLFAVMEMLQEEEMLPHIMYDRDMVKLKRDKIEKYFKYCEEIGTLNKENK